MLICYSNALILGKFNSSSKSFYSKKHKKVEIEVAKWWKKYVRTPLE
jgi:hypothetical protein